MNVDTRSANPVLRPETRFLTRREAANRLKLQGLRISYATLGQMAWRGDGPPYSRFGRDAMYRVTDLDAWVEQRLGRAARENTAGD